MTALNPALTGPAESLPGDANHVSPERGPEGGGEQRFAIRGLDWSVYRKISDALAGRHYRLSFDGEDLELMTISKGHAAWSRLIVLMVFILAEETGRSFEVCGDMTLERDDLERGIESDECFYFDRAAAAVEGKAKLDPTVDPPPDLGVEIDLATNSRRRMSIYAAIGVGEIWRFNGMIAEIHQRQAAGQYALAEHSLHFPFLTAPTLTRFLQRAEHTEKRSLLNSFRQWVRRQISSTS